MQANKIIIGTLVLFATGVAGFAAGKTSQVATPPGAEHELLARLAGEYTAKVGGMLGETDGAARIETVLGGLWSIRHFESTMMGQPYTGMDIVGFDPLKQKYVSVWTDSVTPLLMPMEGTYDADTKTLTMRGISRGMDGEEAEMVTTTEFRDRGMFFRMKIADAPFMTIDYTAKK